MPNAAPCGRNAARPRAAHAPNCRPLRLSRGKTSRRAPCQTPPLAAVTREGLRAAHRAELPPLAAIQNIENACHPPTKVGKGDRRLCLLMPGRGSRQGLFLFWKPQPNRKGTQSNPGDTFACVFGSRLRLLDCGLERFRQTLNRSACGARRARAGRSPHEPDSARPQDSISEMARTQQGFLTTKCISGNLLLEITAASRPEIVI